MDEICAVLLTNGSALNRLGKLYNVKATSDVTFVVGPNAKEFYGHTTVIEDVSDVWKANFSGDWKDKKNVKLKDVEEEVFESLMMYIYKDVIKVKGQYLLDLLELAHRYMMKELVSALTSQVTLLNHERHVWKYLAFAIDFNDEDLKDRCLKIIDEDAEKLLSLPDFLNVKSSVIELIICRNSLSLKEMKLFERLIEWSVAECLRSEPALEVTPGNQRRVMQSFIGEIRFTTMTSDEFASIAKTRILTTTEVAIIQTAKTSRTRDVIAKTPSYSDCFERFRHRHRQRQEQNEVGNCCLPHDSPKILANQEN